MEIRIKGDAHELYVGYINTGNESSFRQEWFDQLEAIAGKVVEVETEHLFKDQFNTAPIPGVSELGLRIFHRYVEEVIDDERVYRMRCHNCGVNSDVHKKCSQCGEEKNLEPLSTEAEVVLDYKRRAEAEREAGGACEVNNSLTYVAIKMSSGSEYFMQGEEAEEMIKEYEDIEWLWACDIEDYFLAIAQNW